MRLEAALQSAEGKKHKISDKKLWPVNAI